ncbi:unnamed protein product [Caenorhabditis auriculariae]|uniref:Uncharacterized protein n=1 Tax=Caenorhabditis auriculariae TaxID=2777116 RepID=A0A8S1GXX8_9PELO|nr:unnamed protein product [Caenorhabditis auriculariae]
MSYPTQHFEHFPTIIFVLLLLYFAVVVLIFALIFVFKPNWLKQKPMDGDIWQMTDCSFMNYCIPCTDCSFRHLLRSVCPAQNWRKMILCDGQCFHRNETNRIDFLCCTV